MPAESSGTPLDPVWIEAFRAQLATQRAASSAVGAAVRDVMEYCSESGLNPTDAFGDPRAYAASLSGSLPAREASPWFSRVRWPTLGCMLEGLFASTYAAFSSIDGRLAISVGAMISGLVAIPMWIAITTRVAEPSPRDPRTPERRAHDESGWRGLILALLLIAVIISLCLGFPAEVFEAATPIIYILAAIMIVVGVLLQRGRRL